MVTSSCFTAPPNDPDMKQAESSATRCTFRVAKLGPEGGLVCFFGVSSL